MPATVVILRSVKPVERRGKILLINAINLVAREQAQSFLRDTHQQKIVDAYQRFADVDEFAAIATIDQIAAKGFSLAISLYVAGAEAVRTGERIDVHEGLTTWREAARDSDASIDDVLALLRAEVAA
jgi:type I restriction enzyme M protein